MGNEAIAAIRAQGSDETAATLQAAFSHHKAGRFDDAGVLYQKVLSTVPNQPNALHWLGVMEAQRGHIGRSIELIRQALPALDQSADVHFDLGNVLRIAGKRREAVESFRRAIALKPDYVTAHVWIGNVFSELGRYEIAISHCRTAIAIDTKSILARVVLASILKSAGMLPEAAEAWRELIELEPDRGDSYYQLAVQLNGLDLFKEAVYCCDRAIALEPDKAIYHCLKGSSQLRLYDGEQAEATFRRALAISPESKEGLAGLSWTLRMLGRFDEADECVKRLHEIDPSDLRDVRHLPSSGGKTAGTEAERLAEVLDDPDTKANDRIVAGFALGRLFDEAQQFDKAFSHYATANALVRHTWPMDAQRFDAGTFTNAIDGLIKVHTPEHLAEAAHWGNISEIPVFIVGMPRSGTTLVEQICASHSQIFGAGELDGVSRIAREMLRDGSNGAPLPHTGRREADKHILALRRLGRNAVRVVDKMPDNILLVGLIARLFPRARIIYCSRDSRDIALSCYFQLFAEGAQHFSYDLTDCGRRCRDVARLAAHWLNVLPLRTIEVNYEKLVADLEGQSKRLIEFLGLDWEPSCLDFHRTQRTVATVSHWQVRQPIYSNSIERWRHYEKHLGPLFATLAGDAASAPLQPESSAA